MEKSDLIWTSEDKGAGFVRLYFIWENEWLAFERKSPLWRINRQNVEKSRNHEYRLRAPITDGPKQPSLLKWKFGIYALATLRMWATEVEQMKLKNNAE